jgi:hypothetical protein
MHEYTTKKRAKLQAKLDAPVPAEKVNIPQMATNLTRRKSKSYVEGKVPIDPKTWKPSLGEIFHINSKIKGTKQLIRGGQAGGALGVALGAGGYALYRHDKRKRRESPATQALLDARRADEPVAKAFFKPKKPALALAPKPKTNTWSAADDESKAKAITTQKLRFAMRQTA